MNVLSLVASEKVVAEGFRLPHHYGGLKATATLHYIYFSIIHAKKINIFKTDSYIFSWLLG